MSNEISPCLQPTVAQYLKMNVIDNSQLYPFIQFFRNGMGRGVQFNAKTDYDNYCTMRVSGITLPTFSEELDCNTNFLTAADDTCMPVARAVTFNQPTCFSSLHVFRNYFMPLMLTSCMCKEDLDSLMTLTNILTSMFAQLISQMPNIIMHSLCSDVAVCGANNMTTLVDFIHYSKLPVMPLAGKLTLKALTEIGVLFAANSRGKSSQGRIIMFADTKNFLAIKQAYATLPCCTFLYKNFDDQSFEFSSNDMINDPSSGITIIRLPDEAFRRNSAGAPFLPIFYADALSVNMLGIPKSSLNLGHAQSTFFAANRYGIGLSGYSSHGDIDYGGTTAKILAHTRVGAHYTDRLGLGYVIGEPTAGAGTIGLYDKTIIDKTPDIAEDIPLINGMTLAKTIDVTATLPDTANQKIVTSQVKK